MAQRGNCAVSNKKLFGPMVHHMSLSKTLDRSEHCDVMANSGKSGNETSRREDAVV